MQGTNYCKIKSKIKTALSFIWRLLKFITFDTLPTKLIHEQDITIFQHWWQNKQKLSDK